ncbi:hypothetical protein [Photobacterium lutimaris]|uniref:Uncharacterized protein n=1 Tax=Photobacterium lutimaris TaxID=388278 RepID=A0A2T3ITL2_9GAMM|nr:hypothetical protein [Photobacterium lutimaris]PSU31700.1 hypothetical protein C9I99_21165 [Photobacterium lutimaris]TDR72663.1 hypothetical protein DFP78_113139 [Photobacterium lutimaris]
MSSVNEQAIGDEAELLAGELNKHIANNDAEAAKKVMRAYRDFRLSASEYHKDLGLVLVLEQHFAILKSKFFDAFGYEWEA